jgi:hypothetical protein
VSCGTGRPGPDGTLWLYTNSGNNTTPYSSGSQIGNGWQNFS